MATKHHNQPASGRPSAPLLRPVAPPVQEAPPANLPIPPRPATVDEEAIRIRAYQLWDAAGRPEGDGVNFWVEAECELNGH